MIVIFGGAYQGKLEYAKKTYGLTDQDLFFCREDTDRVDFSRKAICYLDSFIYAMISRGEDPFEYLKKHAELLSDKIIICNDLSCGIVPTDPLMRRFREENGRILSYLCQNAGHVIRIFCSLPLTMKC
ncbi:hypothetical protein SDC9_189311 [bioreactor metagenome]|uniref:Adenosylcobinamide kinase n=1 Tax=bioreactor metagenome TaxID=1076179 RepID=A0A645HT61_9ZZZZ